MNSGANNNRQESNPRGLRRLQQWARGQALPLILAAVLLVTALVDGHQYNRNRDTTAYVLENAVAVMGENFYTDGEIVLTGLSGIGEDYLRRNLFLQGDEEFVLQKESKAADTATILLGNPQNRTYEVGLRMPRANTTLRWQVNEPTMTAELLKSSIVQGESIYINFSEEVSPDAVKRYLRLDGVSPEYYNVHVTGMITEVRLSSELANDWYDLYLPRDITTVHDMVMKESYHFRVAVRPQRKTVKRPYQVSLNSNLTEILKPGQNLSMEFSTNAMYWPTQDVTVTVYQFPSIDNYQQTSELYNLRNKEFYDPAESDALRVLEQASTTLRQGLSEITFENPDLGAYLLEAVYHNPLTESTDRIRKMVLVTDLMMYAQSVGGETLLWVNSVATGGPLAGHRVDFLDSKGEVVLGGTTDSDGISVLGGQRNPYEDYDWFHWVRVRDAGGNTIYADTTDVLTWKWSSDNERYFSYFYLDRGIYKPNDEINFWGYIKGHQSNQLPTPGEVRVVFDPGGLNLEVMATVDSNNIFHGSIALDKVKSSYYTVSVTVPYARTEYQRGEDGDVELVEVSGDRALHSEYIQVKEFQKPLFIISAENDKLYYNYDEDVTVTINPKFYDGTPLPNYELEYVVYDSYYGEEAIKDSVLTDDEGRAQITFPAFQLTQDPFAWRPATGRYRIMIKSDGEDISYTGTYTYFPTDLMLRVSTEVDVDCNATIKALVNQIDLSSIQTAEDLQAITQVNYYYYNDTYQYDNEAYDALIGNAADRTIQASLTLSYYNYQGVREERTRTYELRTSSGEAEEEIDLSELFGVRIDTGSSCWLQASYSMVDSQNRRVGLDQSAYKPSRSEEGRSSSGGLGSSTTGDSEPQEPQYYEGYSFAVTNEKGENAVGDYRPYSNYDEVWFNAGEKIIMTLQYDGRTVPNNGQMLYTVIQDKIIQRAFTAEPRLEFTESTDFASHVTVVAAYFDGRNIHPIRDTVVGLASDSIRLNIETTSNKVDYRPGEQATISVKVTDSEGRGVSSSVLVSIVDESIFALREHTTEVLAKLYQDSYYYNFYVNKYSTTQRGVSEGGVGDGGKGDGDDVAFDDGTRKNFRDTAIFRSLHTNANGEASFTFTLPDNITSWRVTSLGIGDNMFAGQEQSNFITTKPFFISPVVSEKYIAGDDVALQVRGYGVDLPPDGDVSFTVTMTGDNYSQTFNTQAKAFQASHINFGRLPIGEYTLTATAQHAQSRDAVELPVTVISSNLELVVNRPIDLKQPLDMNVMRYPVTMSFYSREHEPYFQTISSLLRHYCNIANQRMSRYTAKRALMSFMDPGEVPRYLLDGTDSVSDMQNSDGGIAWYPDSSSDVELTAKVVLLAADQFNLHTMKNYFDRAIEQYGYDLVPSSELGSAKPDHEPDRDLVAYSYLGLAAMGEPVTQQVNRILALPDNKPEQQAILVAALAYAGDSGAAGAYEQYITPYVDRRAEGSSVRYYTSPKEQYRNETVTAAAWIAASRLAHGDADQFALYFGRYSWSISTLFEAMVYVNHYDKPVEPIQFGYEMNGETHEADLGLTGRMTMKLGQSAFESFRMLDAPDDLAATAYYIGEPSEADIEPSGNIGINKKITSVGNKRYDVTITVTFGDDAETGQYDISDWVPSNLRMYNLKSYYGANNWSASSTAEGQKLYFRLWRDSASVKTATINYTVQEVFEAGAMVDSTYIIHGNSGDSNLTPRYRWDLPD